MKLKPYVIVGFTYLQYLLLLGLFATFIHFMYTQSKIHALILIGFNLTYLVSGYSIRVIGRDYLNEFYAKLSKENFNGKEEG